MSILIFFYVPGRKKNKQGTFFPARNSVLITDFSKPDPVRKSQPVNDLMLIFPSQRNFSLSSGFSVERLRQVLLFGSFKSHSFVENQITRNSNYVCSLNYFYLHFFNSSAESIIFQYFTAEDSNRCSLILKLSFAVQLHGQTSKCFVSTAGVAR